MPHYIPFVVLFPLIGFLVLGLFGSRIKNEKVIGILGCGTIGLSFALALAIFISMLGMPAEERRIVVPLFTWIGSFTGSSNALSVNVAYLVDQLSILMTLIVTGVGFLIHVYSIGYMHGDKGYWRFFTYMNLFIFAMLNLVLADNFVLFFLGWEGVGLCSYLLIGFWYEKKFAEEAARKAFIVNRIGDFAFMTGMFLIFKSYGSLEFSTAFGTADTITVSSTVSFWIALLLFIGATGKSAQIPLFVWLPDAMAGPTPVSALIHAATMVTAGVYMVARCSILFALAPDVLTIIAVVGAVTAIFAATIGLVQNDIKKVLAYSTISQLGYMFLAMGVAAFSAGIFHLMTHAFFKALLFLGSGAVIHAMHDEQDIQKMGGLKKYLPVTYKTFFIGALAISGIPPLSGFFSKDEILWMSFSSYYGSIILWIVGAFGAGLTAFYMFRLVSLTFEGDQRFGHDQHPHEAPKTMTVPLIILAALSIIGGFVGIPRSLGGSNAIEHWLEPVIAPARDRLRISLHEVEPVEYLMMAISVAIAAGCIYVAHTIYLRRKEIAESVASKFPLAYRMLSHKYYVDEAYDAVVVKPVLSVSEKLLWKRIDGGIIDGLIHTTAKGVVWVGDTVKFVQTGIVESYALTFIVGVIVLLGFLIF
jgi:NADH-quinone oxidoreductase subunit L